MAKQRESGGELVNPLHGNPLWLSARATDLEEQLAEAAVHVVVDEDRVEHVLVLALHERTLLDRATHLFLLHNTLHSTSALHLVDYEIT